MATWVVTAFEINKTSVVGGAGRTVVNTALGLANSTAWSTNKKISVGSYNNYMHVVDTSAVTAVDRCPRSGQTKHIQCVSRGSDASKYTYINTTDGNTLVTNRTISKSSPQPWQCVEFHFNHAQAVILDPIQIWSGSGNAVTDYLRAASVYLLEANTSANRAWAESTPSSKLTLTSRLSASTDHRIYAAFCAKINAVAFNSNGRIKISATYS